MKRITTEQFIEEAKKVHGNVYDYSLVDYVAAKQKVKIICKKHGTFEQTPNDHKTGYRCPGCFIKRAKTNDDFIAEAKNIHGDLYDYSLVDYKSTHTKIKILCKDHGVFDQRPMDHLHLNGCPDCAKRGYIPSKGGWLYYIKFSNNECEFFKIGITNGEVETRINHFYLNKDIVTDIILTEWFDDGYIPQKIERSILQENKKFKFDTANQYMKNGFSETFSEDILKIDKNFDIIKQYY